MPYGNVTNTSDQKPSEEKQKKPNYLRERWASISVRSWFGCLSGIREAGVAHLELNSHYEVCEEARIDPVTIACATVARAGLAPSCAVAARLLLCCSCPRAATTRWNRTRRRGCWAWPIRASPMASARHAIGRIGLAPIGAVATLIDLCRTSP
jgi:hypothetical protein